MDPARLDRARLPLGIMVLVLVATTFLAWTLGPHGLLGKVLWALDLRQEGNPATVLEVVLILACGASFLSLARLPAPRDRFEDWQRLFCRAAAGVCFFLAADEAFSFHVFLGRTFEVDTGILDGQRVDQAGFSWLLFYGPACIAFLVLLRRACHRPARAILDPVIRRRARRALALGLVAAPLVLLVKVEEVWMVNTARVQTMLPCLKETLEVTAVFAILTGNVLLARSFAAETAARSQPAAEPARLRRS